MNNPNLEKIIAHYNFVAFTIKAIETDFKSEAALQEMLRDSKNEMDEAATKVVLAYAHHLNGGSKIEDEALLKEAKMITHSEIELSRISEETRHAEEFGRDAAAKIDTYLTTYALETKYVVRFAGVAAKAVQDKLKDLHEQVKASFMFALQYWILAKENNIKINDNGFFAHICSTLKV